MGETEEVSKEAPKAVVEADDKCGLEMGSNQDPTKPNCNGTTSPANDLDNSYVFVSGDDGKKVVAAGDEGGVEKVEPVDGRLGVVGEVLDEGGNGFLEVSKGGVLEVDVSASKDEDGERSRGVLEVDASASKDVCVGDLVEGSNGESECLVEGEVKRVEEGPDGNVEQREGNFLEVDVSTSKDVSSRETEISAEGEVKQVEEGPDGNVEQSEGGVEEVDVSSAEGGVKRVEGPDGNVEQSKAGVEEVDVSTSKDVSSRETESSADGEVKQVEGPDGNVEILAEAAVEKVGDQNGKIEGANEDGEEKFDDLTKSESASLEDQESEVGDFGVGDQNGKIEGVDEGGEDKFDNLTKSESAPVESQESRVGDLGSVAESGVNVELSNISSHIDSSDSANNGCVDQIELGANETAEACQGSQHVAVNNVVECELQDVNVGAKDEVKLERKVLETSEHEVVAQSGEDMKLSSISSHTDSSIRANDVSADQINLSQNGTSEVRPRSENVAVDAADCKSLDVSGEAKDEENIEKEVVETAEHVTPPSISLDLDSESGENANNKAETFKQESGENANILSNIDDSSNANDECEDQISQKVVVDLVDSELQGSSGETKDLLGREMVENVDAVDSELQGTSGETKDLLQGEIVETVEHEIPPSNSLGLDMESYAMNSKEETVKEGLGDNEELHNILLQTSNSADSNDECEVKTLESCQGSQDVVADVTKDVLQDVSLEAENEVKVTSDMMENAEQREIPPSSSLDLDSEPNLLSNKEETLKDEAATTVSLDVLENQRCSPTFGDDVLQGVLGQMDEAKRFAISTHSHMETVSDTVLEEKNKEDSLVSQADSVVLYPEQSGKHPDVSEESGVTLQSDPKSEVSAPADNFPAPSVCAPQTNTEISGGETIGAVSSSPVDGQKSKIIENEFHEVRCPAKDSRSGSDATIGTAVPPETFDLKLEPAVQDSSTIRSGEGSDDVTVVREPEVSDSLNVNKEDASDIVLETEDVHDMGEPLDSAAGSDEQEQDMDAGNSQRKDVSVTSLGDSDVNMINGEAVNIVTKTKPFNFLIRIPRFDDENLREQIRLAKLHVDEKTKLRDAIQVQIQEKRANNQVHGIDYEYAKGDSRSARKLVRSKRMEIDSLQSVINKAKNALSIEDIDRQIYNMEHMIQHETLPLKEEKQLIREIKQLKQLREQLSSNMGSEDEIKQALEQKEDVEERLKVLRKELDVLKGKVLKAEAAAVEAGKRYDDEFKMVKELQAQFRAADDVRQEAYAQWQSLRKELSQKNKHFFKYKDDAAHASNYAFARDTEALYRFCTNHVENFMELWNTNDEFRREYVKSNVRSTVRRFGTLDGRSLGPDEVPPTLPSYVDERRVRRDTIPVKVDPPSQISTPELKQEATIENEKLDGKSIKKVTESKNQKATNTAPPAVPIQMNNEHSVSDRDITINEVHEEPKKSMAEIESIRKAEEMRKEEVDAKLKEQRRLEDLAKANEARERKKRQAEKIQMRAELKTQKEAEQREKEREKRLRKKERKKAATTDGSEANSETAQSSESAADNKEAEVKEMPAVAPKKQPQKTKQSKTKSVVPPALRNRNKKKWQQWMWVGITSIIILVLFWLGNIGVFSNVNLKRRSPPY